MFDSPDLQAFQFLSFACQVTVVGIAALASIYIFKSRPYICYGILSLAVIKCVIPPINPGFFTVEVPVVSAKAEKGVTPQFFDKSQQPIPQLDTPTDSEKTSQSGISGAVPPSRFSNIPPVKKPPTSISSKPKPITPPEKVVDKSENPYKLWWILGTGLYLMVGIGLILSAIVSIFRTKRQILRHGNVRVPEEISILFNHCQTQLNLKNVQLRITDCHIGPLALGFFKPQVVIPGEVLQSHSNDELKTLFLHELNHIKRNDIILGWIQTIAVCLWWFHPIVWILSSRLSRWREYCCDLETMAIQNISPKEYCLRLLKVSSDQQRSLYPLRFGVSPFLILEQRMKVLMTNSKSNHRQMPLRLKVALFALACFLLPNVMGFRHQPPASFENDHVIFYSSGNGTVKMSMKGKDRRFPFKTTPNTSNGTVSPDGKSLAYVAWTNQKRQVWVSTADGKMAAVTPNHGQNFVNQIEWSPDGKKIAYRTDGGFETAVYVMNPDGSDHRKLKSFGGQFSRGFEYYHEFCWTPDSKSLIIAKAIEINTNHYADMITVKRLCVLQQHWLDGDRRKELTKIGGRREMSNLSCSPDGKWVAYKSNRNLMVQKIEKAGSPETLVASVNPDGFPKWSSDSRQILVHTTTNTSPAPPGKKVKKAGSRILKVGIDKSKTEYPVAAKIWDYDWDGSGKTIHYTNSEKKLYKIQLSNKSHHVMASDVGFWGSVQLRKVTGKGKNNE